ncbi:hypothetical protein AU468_03425 [Alkalispirochaeta sphaeroplastigenens]|uniref:STAS domain-containing protein n=1 Tax=Alkalispirochaeta sphaeroplastigenens TaxID=1187066 RepID=A0A2S4JXD3_9SPIO|nr:STAS/SEC14 domain-containing protein [Alkalispirochaeta sphaeroplastigenens]POR04187.1 hypothetical protein AU468_03425 [Alkalispirochaeta sphaeroplastigenens]
MIESPVLNITVSHRENDEIIVVCVEGMITHTEGFRIAKDLEKALAIYGSQRILIDLRKARNISKTIDNFGFAQAASRKGPEFSKSGGPLRMAFLTDPEDRSHDRVLSLLFGMQPSNNNRLISKDGPSALNWLRRPNLEPLPLNNHRYQRCQGSRDRKGLHGHPENLVGHLV